jgi:hypothetical protein
MSPHGGQDECRLVVAMQGTDSTAQGTTILPSHTSKHCRPQQHAQCALRTWLLSQLQQQRVRVQPQVADRNAHRPAHQQRWTLRQHTVQVTLHFNPLTRRCSGSPCKLSPVHLIKMYISTFNLAFSACNSRISLTVAPFPWLTWLLSQLQQQRV